VRSVHALKVKALRCHLMQQTVMHAPVCVHVNVLADELVGVMIKWVHNSSLLEFAA
jgi:hypothetical protein